MSKPKSRRKQSKAGARSPGGSRAVLVIGLAMTLAVAGVITASNQRGEESVSVATAILSPSSPSKEYVYAGGRLIATEEPANTPACTYSISPSSQSFAHTGGGGSFNVTTTPACDWTATSAFGFITITIASGSGSGNGQVSFSVAPNTGSSRSGTISVGGRTFTVNQDAAPVAGCSYSLSPTGQAFGAAGGNSNVAVTATAGCGWTAVSNDSWLSISSGTSGTGNGSVSYSVAANPAGPRTGTMTIAGQTFTLTQDAAAGCSYSISPTTASYTSNGGSGSFNVFTAADCNWTAERSALWVSITSGATGSGNGPVGYSVEPDSGGSRTGTISVQGQTFTITQEGASTGGACTSVSTFSGTGTYGHKEGLGPVAQWRKPVAGVIAKDPVSLEYALFVADTENHCIRRVILSSGSSSTIAGTPNVAGYFEPADGIASSARYNHPRGIAAITDSNDVVTALLVADTDNQVIRKLTPPSGGSWRTSHFSGTVGEAEYRDGSPLFSVYNNPHGIVVSGPQGTQGGPSTYIYVADMSNGAIRKLDQAGNSTPLVSAGTFINPVGITASRVSGQTVQLYVSDQLGHSIWKVSAATGAAELLAGAGFAGNVNAIGSAASFNLPSHLAWANTTSGEVLFIADRQNHRIRKIIISSGVVSTYAGQKEGWLDGGCGVAKFALPYGVAVGPTGIVYVMDNRNNRIRKIQ